MQAGAADAQQLAEQEVVGGTPDTITSTTRLVFSSITPVITTWPHIRVLT